MTMAPGSGEASANERTADGMVEQCWLWTWSPLSCGGCSLVGEWLVDGRSVLHLGLAVVLVSLRRVRPSLWQAGSVGRLGS